MDEQSIESYIANSDDMKCAPGVNFEDGSCIKLSILTAMADAYNEENPKEYIKLEEGWEMTNPKQYKKYLLKELAKRTGENCNNQFCWTQQKFIKRLDSMIQEELTRYTFRPKGPEGKFDWLSNFDILKVLKQYELPCSNFKFLGAVPMDFDNIQALGIKDFDFDMCEKQGKTILGIVFNTDESWKGGEHWVSSYIDLEKRRVYYFDSVGIGPEIRVRKFFRRVIKYMIKRDNITKLSDIDIRYNKVRHQFKDTECGVYSIYFILSMMAGKSFKEVTETIITDDKINKFREKFFL